MIFTDYKYKNKHALDILPGAHTRTEAIYSSLVCSDKLRTSGKRFTVKKLTSITQIISMRYATVNIYNVISSDKHVMFIIQNLPNYLNLKADKP